MITLFVAVALMLPLRPSNIGGYKTKGSCLLLPYFIVRYLDRAAWFAVTARPSRERHCIDAPSPGGECPCGCISIKYLYLLIPVDPIVMFNIHRRHRLGCARFQRYLAAAGFAQNGATISMESCSCPQR